MDVIQVVNNVGRIESNRRLNVLWLDASDARAGPGHRLFLRRTERQISRYTFLYIFISLRVDCFQEKNRNSRWILFTELSQLIRPYYSHPILNKILLLSNVTFTPVCLLRKRVRELYPRTSNAPNPLYFFSPNLFVYSPLMRS